MSPMTPPVWLDYPEYLRLLREEDAALAEEFVSFTGVKDVLDWAQRRGALSRDDIDMVGQDEFHYDFLVRLGPEGRWLAFGVT
jgi:hypothetical protein